MNNHEWTRPLGSSGQYSQHDGSDDEKPCTKFSSYKEFLDHMSNGYGYSQLEFVAEFLKNTPPIALLNNETRSPSTRTLVADLMDDHWRFTTELDLKALSRNDRVRSRVVVLDREVFAFVDRALLDLVACHYHLNPLDLWFILERVLVSRYYPDSAAVRPSFPFVPLATPRQNMPVALWNGIPSDELDLMVDGAACFVIDPKEEDDCHFATVLILSQFGKIPKTSSQRDQLEASAMAGMDVFRAKTYEKALPPKASLLLPLDLYVESLAGMSADAIIASPCELVFPYLRLVVWRIRVEVEQMQKGIFGDKAGGQSLKTDATAIEKDLRIRAQVIGTDFSISRGLTMIRRFMAVRQLDSSDLSRTGMEIVEELERLSALNQRLQDEMDRYV